MIGILDRTGAAIGNWLAGDEQTKAINAKTNETIEYLNQQLRAGQISQAEWNNRYKQVVGEEQRQVDQQNIARNPSITDFYNRRVEAPLVDAALDMKGREARQQQAVAIAMAARAEFEKSARTPADRAKLTKITNDAFRASGAAQKQMGVLGPVHSAIDSAGSPGGFLQKIGRNLRWVAIVGGTLVVLWVIRPYITALMSRRSRA